MCKKKRKPNGYWTFENCKREAKKYNTKRDFELGNLGAYKAANRKKYSDKICKHMKPKVSESKSNGFINVYVYLFPDNYFYVGLTDDLERRNREHLSGSNDARRKSRVWKHIQKTGNYPEEIILEENISILSNDPEGFWVDYFTFLGFNKLNIAKTGSIGGGVIKWSKERCKKEALKYDNKTVFKKNNKLAYKAIYRNGWLDELCSHMSETKKPNGYWIKEKCIVEALKYKYRSDFQNNSLGAYLKALRNGWLDEICSHMIKPKSKKLIYTFEICNEEAKKYSDRINFKKGSEKFYNAACYYNFLDILFPKLSA